MPDIPGAGSAATIRLYHDGPLAPGSTITLDAAAAHHAVRVLRLRPGDGVELSNGDVRRYRSTMLPATVRQALVAIDAVADGGTESGLAIGLAQAIPASDKMDWVIEKAVELGVSEIQPLLSQRCVVRLDGERAGRRLEHWRRVIIASCIQCGRDRLPRISAPLDYADWLRGTAPGERAARLLLSPRAGLPVSALAAPAGSVWLLTGPEGGLTDPEEALAIGLSWQPVRLGPRILRAETAGPAALAALQTRFGDF